MRAADRQLGSSHEDVLLSRLYQHITELQEPRFSAGYELDKGLERYRTWPLSRSYSALNRGSCSSVTCW